MKKTVLFILASIAAFALSAQVVFQSNFSNWAGSPLLPTDWMGTKTNLETDSIIQISSGTQYGPYAAQLINTQSSHKRFTTQPLSVDSGQAYQVTFWVKGEGDIRVGLYDDAGSYGYEPYSSYFTVNNTTSWTQHSEIITADTSFSSAEFILSVRYTVAPMHLEVDSVAITKTTINLPLTSIHDIEYTTDPSGDSPDNGQMVRTKGVVTAIASGAYFIQDGTGGWSGLYVYDNVNSVSRGDSVFVTGTISEYYGLTELGNLTSFTKTTGGVVPAPASISTAAVDSEQYEAVLVKVTNATCTNDSAGYGEWSVDDGSGMCQIHDLIYHYPNPVVNDVYSVTGPDYYGFSEFKIEPRDSNDVVVASTNGIANLSGSNSGISIYPNPSTDFVNIKGVQNTTISVFDATGKMVFETKSVDNIYKLNTENYKSGVYFIQLEKGNIKIQKKLIVE